MNCTTYHLENVTVLLSGDSYMYGTIAINNVVVGNVMYDEIGEVVDVIDDVYNIVTPTTMVFTAILLDKPSDPYMDVANLMDFVKYRVTGVLPGNVQEF